MSTYRPGTALARLVELARQAPREFHLNDADAQSVQVTLTLGQAAIGRLMTCAEAANALDEHELYSLGQLIWALSETAHQIGEMLGDHLTADFVKVLEANQAPDTTT